MPEGDTIWRTARTLGGVLTGKVVTGFRSPLPAVAATARQFQLVGQTVEKVESNGKHLLIRFSGGLALHTHLRMTGSWCVYRPGTPWGKSSRAARVVLETANAVAVCFYAPVVELWPPGAAATHPVLARLGPDLLAPDFDCDEAVRRLRERQEMQIGVALMDQTALAGIGNVYKSEILFLCGVHPFQRVGDLDAEILRAVVRTAQGEMRRNLGPGMRRTRPGMSFQRVWVYGRSERSCFRCGTKVLRRAQGEQARISYWCPQCQQIRPPAANR
jgi:endonuclease-8